MTQHPFHVLSGAPNETLPPLVALDVTSISLVLLVLGAYVCGIGQLSYFLKERLYISSALISVAVGIAVGPSGANIISSLKWTGGDELLRNEITFQFMRLVIGIQVMFAGISLPAAYLRREWKSLFVLLLPIMSLAWVISAGLILALIPKLSFLEALVISACITPTDPVLAASIVRGRYAEKHVARNVRDIISAESGANDGLGYPFIFLPILLMRQGDAPLSKVFGEWIVSIWIYDIFLSCAIGAVIGYVARKTLKVAHRRKLVDHESFLAYGVGLAFLTLGIVGVLGSDDLLATFVAGNSLTWQDFYRIEAEDDTFQDVIDSLLNASVFIYIGTLIPWSSYSDLSIPLEPWRMVVLAVLILLLKRLPWVVFLQHSIPALEDRPQAIFAGWFGPIGVSAVYYAMVALKELPQSRTHLRETIVPIVLFITFGSTFAHGISIPISKFGPRVLTHTKSTFDRTTSQTNQAFKRLRAKAVAITDISAPILPEGLDFSTLGLKSPERDDADEERGEGGKRDGLMKMDNPNIEGSLSQREEGEGDTGSMSRSYSTLLRFRSQHPSTSDVSLGGIDKSAHSSPSPATSRPSSTHHSNHSRSGSIAGGTGEGRGGDAANYRISNAPGILAGGIISTPGTRPGTPSGARVEFVIPEST